MTNTDACSGAVRRGIAKFNRIKARDPCNPDYDERYLQRLIEEEFQFMADRDYINAAGELNRGCRSAKSNYQRVDLLK